MPPTIRGDSVQHHKPDNPLRPIVTSIGSALYHTSMFLTDILSPLQNKNGLAVENSKEFVREISGIEISDDEVMVSFDVISLFTEIPVHKAYDYIKEKLEQDSTLSHRTHLEIDGIVSLLNFVLSNNYFLFEGQTYKYTDALWEVLLAQSLQISAWKRYAVETFHNTLNSLDPSIQFTLEHEHNGKLAFLDTVITRENGKHNIDVHRKPTNTDKYLDYNSHHQHKHKTSTANVRQ